MSKLCGLTMVVLLGSFHVSAAELSSTTATTVETAVAKTRLASTKSTPKAGLQVMNLKLTVSRTDTKADGESAKSTKAKSTDTERAAAGSSPSKQAASKQTSSTPKVLKPVKRKVLIFTASWCGACQALKYEFPALKQVGWRIGGKGTDHIQLVDADRRLDLMSRYGVNSLPPLVLVDDEKELSRSGSLDARNIAEFYYGRLK